MEWRLLQIRTKMAKACIQQRTRYNTSIQDSNRNTSATLLSNSNLTLNMFHPLQPSMHIYIYIFFNSHIHTFSRIFLNMSCSTVNVTSSLHKINNSTIIIVPAITVASYSNITWLVIYTFMQVEITWQFLRFLLFIFRVEDAF